MPAPNDQFGRKNLGWRPSSMTFNKSEKLEANKMQIHIENLFFRTNRQTITISNSEDMTVEQLRGLVIDTEKLGSDNQCLLYKNEVMGDNRTLKSYNVRNNDVITIVPHMKSGPVTEIDKVAVKREAKNLQREVIELLQFDPDSPSFQEEDCYAFEKMPKGKLRPIRYTKTTCKTPRPTSSSNKKTDICTKSTAETDKKTKEVMKHLKERMAAAKQKRLTKSASKSLQSLPESSAKSCQNNKDKSASSSGNEQTNFVISGNSSTECKITKISTSSGSAVSKSADSYISNEDITKSSGDVALKNNSQSSNEADDESSI